MFGRLIEIVSYPFQLLFSAPVAVLTASRAVRAFSLPARAALAVAVFMVLLTIVGTILSSPLVRHDAPDMRTILWTYTLPIAICALITPPVVYVSVWLWSE